MALARLFGPQLLHLLFAHAGGRHDDGVDHVNDAIGAGNVGLHDSCVVDHDGGTVDFDANVLAFNGLGGGELDDVSGHDFAGDDVIEQDVLELGGVLEKRVDGAGGELGKSLIGGSEDSERTSALEGVDESGCL